MEFYKNGNLSSKQLLDNDAKIQGRVYFFYEGTNNLSAYFNYVDDQKFGLAQEYHDTTANLKSQMMYNDREEKFWHKYFSTDGVVIKEEGKLNL